MGDMHEAIFLGKFNAGGGDGSGGTSDYTQLTNKPSINSTTLSGNKTSAELGLVSAENGKGLSTEDYTTAEKTKLGGIEAEANKTVVDSALDGTSTNPVENQVIKAALDLKANAANLGTAASKDVPVSGDAAATEVVMGNDSRLAHIDANGNLWIGDTQIWELIDDASYAALASKNNRLYFVYPASS